MGIFRSEDMTLFQIRVPKDDAWDVMNRLGGLDLAHFLNLNKAEQPFNLPYANQIKRCEETERRLLYILGQCKTLGVPVNKPRDIQSFLTCLEDIRGARKRAANLLFEAIENDVIEQERFVIEQTEKIREIDDNFNTMCEYEKVLRNVGIIMRQIHGNVGGPGMKASMHGGLNPDTEGLKYRGSLNADEQAATPLLGGDMGVAIT
jgi:V-type H+-transporting ATPase subunit a